MDQVSNKKRRNNLKLNDVAEYCVNRKFVYQKTVLSGLVFVYSPPP